VGEAKSGSRSGGNTVPVTDQYTRRNMMLPERYRESLNDALEYLLQLQREGVVPRQALARLGPLQERHPEMEMDLAWHEEAFARVVEYSALLRLPGDGTLSLGFCPERAVPWPLRGAYHSREEEIVRVDQWRLTLLDVMTFLDFIWKDTGLIRQLVDQALIATEAARRALEPTDAELQDAMDEFRQAHGLITVAATVRWLDERGLTQAALEQKVAERLRRSLLRERIAGPGVEDYFERRGDDFDTVSVARLTLPDEAGAREVFAAVRQGTITFLDAAQQAFLASDPRPGQSLFVRLRRADLAAPQAELLFGLQPGEIAPPTASGGGFEIVQVLGSEPARLDDATRERIKDVLFAAWLDTRRSEADIEWFWGDAAATR
jgi:putative peptide maturation system protein